MSSKLKKSIGTTQTIFYYGSVDDGIEDEDLKKHAQNERSSIDSSMNIMIMKINVLISLLFLSWVVAEETVCNTDECQNIANTILSYMDRSVSPCDDFYTYTCGSWSKVNQKPILLQKGNDKYLKILKDPIKPDDNQIVKKFKTFVKSCLKKSTVSIFELSPHLELIKEYIKGAAEEIRSCPALDPSWKSDAWSLEKVLGKIKNLYDFDILLSNEFHKIQLTVKFSFGDSLKDEFLAKVKEYMKLFAKNETVIEELVKETSEFVGQIKEAMTEKNVNESVKWECIFSNETRLNFSMYAEHAYFDKFFNNLITCINVSNNERNVDRIIKETKPEVLANYVVYHFMYLMEQRFRLLDNQGSHTDETEKFDKCLDILKYVLRIPLDIFYTNVIIDKDVKDKVEEIFKYVKDDLTTVVNNSDWIDPGTKTDYLNKINESKLQIGSPQSISDVIISDLLVEEDKYLQNLVNLWKVHQKLDASYINKRRGILYSKRYRKYDMPSRQLNMDAFFFQPPYFHKSFPRYLDYGGIGALIAEITHYALDLPDPQGDAAIQTVMTYLGKTECFKRRYEAIAPPEYQGISMCKLTPLSNGLRSAYSAYKSRTASNILDQLLPGLNHTREEMFFINYGQSTCGEDGHEFARAKYNFVLSNFEEFSKTFNCPLGSLMNPSEKCPLL